jgi:hypothetical protein
MPGPGRNPNYVVPTAPPGTSDSRAASTKFVTSVAGTIGQIPGTTTDDNAAAGNVGEYKSVLVPFIGTVPANMVLLSSPAGTWYQIATLQLTAGNWFVTGFGAFNWNGTGAPGGNTNVSILASAISNFSADPADYSAFAEFAGGAGMTFRTANVPTLSLPIARKKVHVGNTLNVYLNGYAGVTGDTCYGGGFIEAWRFR